MSTQIARASLGTPRRWAAVGFLLVGVAVCVPGATAGAASSKTPVVANGEIVCDNTVGTIHFSPALTADGTAPETITVKFKGTGCWTSGTTNLPSSPTRDVGIVKATGGVSSCATVGVSAGEIGTGTVDYSKIKGAKVGATQVLQTGVSFVQNDTQSLLEMRIPHMLSGSFATAEMGGNYMEATTTLPAPSASEAPAGHKSTASAACGGHKALKTAKITSGQQWW